MLRRVLSRLPVVDTFVAQIIHSRLPRAVEPNKVISLEVVIRCGLVGAQAAVGSYLKRNC